MVRLSVAAPVGLFAVVALVALTAAMTWDPFDPITFVFIATCVLWGAVQVAVGTLIVWRRPENRVGRLLQTSGVLVAAAFVGYFVAAIRMASAGADDLVGGVAGWWASSSLYLAIYAAFPLLGVLYPDGRLPDPRWRLPTMAITAVLLGCFVVFAVAAGPLGPDLPDNPFGVVALPPGMWEVASGVGALMLVVSMALAIVGVAVRWRRGRALERSQLKWLGSAIAVAGVLSAVTFGGGEGESISPLAIIGIGSMSLIPLAIGVAVFRYRLYDIDRLISRTLSWAVITGILLAVFAGAVVMLQAILAGLTQGQTLAVAASTLLAFALTQPLRRRVQAAVDRRFDRARYDGERVVAAFSERVRANVHLDGLAGEVRRVAIETVRPASAAVWLRNATNDQGGTVS
jgi:hypothetical protein